MFENFKSVMKCKYWDNIVGAKSDLIFA